MAKESEERKKVKEKLIKKNDKLPFSLSLYVKVSRMVQDLNRLARAGKSSVSCPLKPSDSAPLKHSTMPP